MHVVISGGSGFLGRALTVALEREGHRVSVLTRKARPGHPGDIEWMPDGGSGPWAKALVSADAIVNLAGEGIADKRWTPARKQALVTSRVQATASLVAAVLELPSPPGIFLSGSGVGYYGDTGDRRINETAPAGADFVAGMAAKWEAAAAPAVSKTRLAYLRTGLVMGHEGALKQMLLPFRLGVGGRLGSGEQWMPWISLADWVGIVLLLLTTPDATGPFNLTSPTPVTNAEFTKTLGRVLRRPTIFPVPAFALKLAFGELSEALLTGQRAFPEEAVALSYRFRHETLEPALRAALGVA